MSGFDGSLSKFHLRGEAAKYLRVLATAIARGDYGGYRLEVQLHPPPGKKGDDGFRLQLRSEGGEYLVRCVLRLIAESDNIGKLSRHGQDLLVELGQAVRVQSVQEAQRILFRLNRLAPARVVGRGYNAD